MEKIRVLVADDKKMMRLAIAGLLLTQDTVQVVGMAEDGEDAVRQAAELRPQVAIQDISMPGVNGLEAARRITAERPGTGIVIVSSYDDTEYIMELLRDGMQGKAYLLKQSIDAVEELTHAIHAVAEGRTVLDPHIAEKLAREYSERMAPGPEAPDGLPPPQTLGPLTDRGRWVLALLAEGYTDDAILVAVHCGRATLEQVMESLRRKLGIPAEEANRLSFEVVLALIDPDDELRRYWVPGYRG